MAERPEVPEEAVYPAAKVIARALRHRAEQIERGTMGDRQTQTPNQVAKEALADAAPAIRKQERQRVKEAFVGKDSMLAWQRGPLLISREDFERFFAALDSLEDSE